MFKAFICRKQIAMSSCTISGSEDTCCPLSLWCCSAAGGHSAGCRTSWVCLQHHAMWWHLMVLQYVAASFHLPSVSTANINTVQYPKTHQQCEVPTIPAVVISKLLLPQYNIKAALVHSHSHSNLSSDVSPVLPTYSNHNVTHCTVLFSTVTCCWPLTLLHKMPNCQHTAIHFHLLIFRHIMVITSRN